MLYDSIILGCSTVVTLVFRWYCSVFHWCSISVPCSVLKPETPEHRTTEHGIPRNNRIRNTSVTVKHPATVAEQLIPQKHQQKTQEYQQNTNVSRAKHPWITKPYESNNNYSVFYRNINLNFSTQSWNIFYYWYTFIFWFIRVSCI